jgi:hypothetical protein
MYKAKKTQIAAIALCLVMCWAERGLAQSASPATPPPAKGKLSPSFDVRVNRWAEDLKLTEEQKPKFRKLIEEETTNLQTLRDPAIASSNRVSAARAIRQHTDDEMKKMLEPLQFGTWLKVRGPSARLGPPPAAATKPAPATGEKPAK